MGRIERADNDRAVVVERGGSVEDVEMNGEAKDGACDVATLAGRLKHALGLRDVTQQGLEVEAKLPKGYVSRVLHGKRKSLSPDMLQRISQALDVDYKWLAIGDQELGALADSEPTVRRGAPPEIFRRIRQTMSDHGIAAREVARRAGMAETQISNMLRKAEANPHLDIEVGSVIAIASALGVSFVWLIAGDGEPTASPPDPEALAQSIATIAPELARLARSSPDAIVASAAVGARLLRWMNERAER